MGESGSGKSTLGRCILQLHQQTEGEVKFDGIEMSTLSGKELRTMRRRINAIFQDPYSSLSPRMTAAGIIGEPVSVHGLVQGKAEMRERIQHLLDVVGLNPYMADRFPHEFSGGQRQRIGIARAIAAEPEFIVADEPVSALDVSIQAQIINLLQELQEQFGLTYLLIAHDLSVVRHISDRVAVMYLGKLMELAPCDDLYEDPQHPYTRALLSAVPVPDPTVKRRASASCCRATSPARRTRRRAASSTRAAPWPSTSVAPSSRRSRRRAPATGPPASESAPAPSRTPSFPHRRESRVRGQCTQRHGASRTRALDKRVHAEPLGRLRIGSAEASLTRQTPTSIP